MKRLLSIILFLCIALWGCTSNNDSTTPAPSTSAPVEPDETANSIVMFEADPLPAEITVKEFAVNAEYDVIIKGVTFREITALEKEKAYTKNLGYIAIIQYSARSKTSIAPNEIRLSDVFAIVLGDSTFKHQIRSIHPDENEYKTDAYAEGYYQGYTIIEVSQEAAENNSTQLRYVEIGSNTPVYYNIHE